MNTQNWTVKYAKPATPKRRWLQSAIDTSRALQDKHMVYARQVRKAHAKDLATR
ncbi:MAG: hypothetical protein AAGF74_14195 [Pseudomonadota bacterium]